MLLYDRLTIDEALNIPTCKLSKSKHKKLNSTKLGSTTPDIWDFWARYRNNLTVKIETHDGTPVDLKTWDLNKHYEYFKL
jgi:hypothetical protein